MWLIFCLQEESHSSGFSSPGDLEDDETPDTPSSTLEAKALVKDIDQKTSSSNIPLIRGSSVQKKDMPQNENIDSADSPRNQAKNSIRNRHTASPMRKSHTLHGGPATFRNKSHEETASMRRPTKWGRTPVSISYITWFLFMISKISPLMCLYSRQERTFQWSQLITQLMMSKSSTHYLCVCFVFFCFPLISF